MVPPRNLSKAEWERCKREGGKIKSGVLEAGGRVLRIKEFHVWRRQGGHM